MKLYKIYASVIILSIVIFSVLYMLLPGVRPSLVDEDRFMENLTVVLFLGSLLLSTIIILRLKNKKKIYTIIPLISIIGFLDEISFGERLFNLTMPKIYGKIKIDAFHDFFALSFQFLKLYGNWLLYAGITLAFVLILIIIIKKQGGKLVNIFRKHPPLLWVLCSLVFISISLLIDLNIISHHFLTFIEELFEMNAALALVFASLSIKQKRR